MCRLFAYLGPPVGLDALLTAPAHSLVVQSYAPREMTAGTICADGHGFAWYDLARRETPFLYRSILPIWNDVNLDDIASFAQSGCVLANVRSATTGQGLDIGNTQPFVAGPLAATTGESFMTGGRTQRTETPHRRVRSSAMNRLGA